LQHKCIQKDRLAAVSQKSDCLVDKAAASSAALFFHFLRQPNRPIAPKPPSIINQVDGNGVMLVKAVNVPSEAASRTGSIYARELAY